MLKFSPVQTSKTLQAFFTVCLISLLYACENPTTDEPAGNEEPAISNTKNYLHDILPFTADSLVNVVIEIPAGTNQKWEVNKATGQVEWEQVNPDSFRVVDYLPYPANYGFIPQTLLPEANGGDGDPVDVFVLGPAIDRKTVARVRIVGIIDMLDDNESDSKLLAVPTGNPGFNVRTYEQLINKYPGVVDIIKLWLSHYKGPDRIQIRSGYDESHALPYVKQAHSDYLADRDKSEK
jgi:inorganic pyrophosphatase